MGNEMGNSNVSELKEEENKEVEAKENSSQETNHDEKGEHQIVPAGEGKDFHEKVEGLSSDHNPPGGGDPPVNKQIMDEKEQDDTELQSSFQSTVVLLPIESSDAANKDSGIQGASLSKDANDDIEKETKSNLKVNMLGAIDDHLIEEQTSTRTGEAEASNPVYDTVSELLTSEPLESVALECNNQDGHSEVHVEPMDQRHKESPSYQTEEKEELVESEATQNLAESVASNAKINEEKIKDDFLIQETRISDDRLEIHPKDEVKNGFDNKCSEEVPSEMNLSRNGSSKRPQESISQRISSNTFEEVFDPQDKLIVLNEDKEVIESISEIEETKHHHGPIQLHDQVVDELKTDENNSSQPDLKLVSSDIGDGKEIPVDSSCNIDKMKEKRKDLEELIGMALPSETVPTELTVKQHNHEEAAAEQAKERVIKAIEERDEILKALSSGTEARENPEKPMSQSHRIDQKQEAEENANIDAELRKSPSFDFDLSLEARSQESDQTPLLHHDKTRTRSLSILDGVANFGNPTHYEAVSVEEKTIEVERSDYSDKARAPLLNFLKDGEKESVEVKTQKQDCEKKVVALTKGSGRRKHRSSLFTTCICCAAAIN